jgi:hypothetical protein
MKRILPITNEDGTPARSTHARAARCTAAVHGTAGYPEPLRIIHATTVDDNAGPCPPIDDATWHRVRSANGATTWRRIRLEP